MSTHFRCVWLGFLLFSLTLSTTLAQTVANLSITPEVALKFLTEGNQRFLQGKSRHPNQGPQRIREVAEAQHPFAVIVSCSDSRVPNEIIFDQGLGDLFIVRTAGQVSTYASWGSIEFGHAALGARLIVVLGHTRCGAVSAACHLPEAPGHIVTLINAIKPAAEMARKLPGDQVDHAVKINVAMQVRQLKGLEPVLSKAVSSGQVQILGAVYNLQTGQVEFLPDDYLTQLDKKNTTGLH